jgi:hypothetical protein
MQGKVLSPSDIGIKMRRERGYAVIDPRLASDLFPVVVERSLRFGFSDVLRFSDSFLIGLLLNALHECPEPHVLRATERDLVRVPLAILPAGQGVIRKGSRAVFFRG